MYSRYHSLATACQSASFPGFIEPSHRQRFKAMQGVLGFSRLCSRSSVATVSLRQLRKGILTIPQPDSSGLLYLVGGLASITVSGGGVSWRSPFQAI